MRASQRKFCSFLVIKERWFPLHAVMALGATRHLSLRELLAMDVFMAILALRWSRFKVHVDQLSFKVRRLVTIDTRRRPMGPQQRKLCLVVVECRQLLPRFRVMAGLASRGVAVGSHLQHSLLELSLVRIGVAAGAIQICPVVNDCRLRLEFLRLLVTVGTRNGNVPPSQNEFRLFMFGQRERGRLISLEVMTAVAGIEVRSGGELPGVPVAMTIRALRKLDLKQCVFALGNVALCAHQAGVTSLQRVSARRVLFERECRRLPSLDVVARSTVASIRTLGKLRVVRIRLVAIHALRELQRLFEVATGMALRTIDRGVLAFQREFRF